MFIYIYTCRICICYIYIYIFTYLYIYTYAWKPMHMWWVYVCLFANCHVLRDYGAAYIHAGEMGETNQCVYSSCTFSSCWKTSFKTIPVKVAKLWIDTKVWQHVDYFCTCGNKFKVLGYVPRYIHAAHTYMMMMVALIGSRLMWTHQPNARSTCTPTTSDTEKTLSCRGKNRRPTVHTYLPTYILYILYALYMPCRLILYNTHCNIVNAYCTHCTYCTVHLYISYMPYILYSEYIPMKYMYCRMCMCWICRMSCFIWF